MIARILYPFASEYFVGSQGIPPEIWTELLKNPDTSHVNLEIWSEFLKNPDTSHVNLVDMPDTPEEILSRVIDEEVSEEVSRVIDQLREYHDSIMQQAQQFFDIPDAIDFDIPGVEIPEFLENWPRKAATDVDFAGVDVEFAAELAMCSMNGGGVPTIDLPVAGSEWIFNVPACQVGGEAILDLGQWLLG